MRNISEKKNYEIIPLETAEREINKNVFDFLCE